MNDWYRQGLLRLLPEINNQALQLGYRPIKVIGEDHHETPVGGYERLREVATSASCGLARLIYARQTGDNVATMTFCYAYDPDEGSERLLDDGATPQEARVLDTPLLADHVTPL